MALGSFSFGNLFGLGGGVTAPVTTPTVEVGATSQVAVPQVSTEMASLPKFNAVDNPGVSINTAKTVAPTQTTTTPKTQSGLGFGEAMKGAADLGGVVVAGLSYLDQKKQQKKDNKVTEWKLAQQTKAANNKLKWSQGLQNSIEGKEVGSENQRQQYDAAPKLT